MTPPREIIPGQMAFVTVRAVGRSYRFTPTRPVRELILFALAVTLAEYDILLHEFEWMSNHYHLLVTDRGGQLPDFMRDLNSLISRGLNAIRGHRGTNIEKGYNIVRPQDDEKAVEHAVYTLANACESALVRRTKHWKGPNSFDMRYGEARDVPRPKAGLWKHDSGSGSGRSRSRGKSTSRGRAARRKPTRFPEVAQLRLTRPPVRTDLTDEELRAEVMKKVDARERELLAERKQSRKRVLGMEKVLAQHWEESPRSREQMFTTVPHVSASSKWARIEALQRRAEFIAAYAVARDAFLMGDHDVEFPPGTWLMRRRYNVCCRPPPI